MSRNPSLGICTLCIFVAAIFCVAVDVHADDRQPIPDEAAQKQADALVQQIFGKQIANAQTPDQKLALTKKLLEEASRPDTTPPGRYGLLKVALKNAPDAKAAMPIVDEMASHFEIDGLKTKASTVWRMSSEARTSSQHQAVAEVALELIEESVERDAYDPAITLSEIAMKAVPRARNPRLVDEVRTKMSEVRKQKVNFEKVQAAVVVLERDPRNAEANLTVGRYQCLVKGDWVGGVPMLALGSDENLKNLAVRDLQMPTQSDQQAALADGWFDQAQKLKEADKQRMLQRAGHWYRLSLASQPALSRLVRIMVEKRLAEVGELLAAEVATKSQPKSIKKSRPKSFRNSKPKSFTNSLGMTLNLIPAGTFMMGSPESEVGHIDNEQQHRVTLSKPFYIGVHEVTQEQYQWQMGTKPSWHKGAKHPVEQVSWNDAVEFCKRLSALPAERSAGRVYRLPTEAEWEYACRAGTTTAYSFGDDASRLGEYAWYRDNSGDRAKPVGEKRPNPWGLYDMYGNVWEWCQDWHGDYPAGAVTDPQGPPSGSSRVNRGGSINTVPSRSASRVGKSPVSRFRTLGFRVVSVSE